MQFSDDLFNTWILIAGLISFSIFSVNAQCVEPEITSVSSTKLNVCRGQSAVFTITDPMLNDADTWTIFKDVCGGDVIETTTSNTFNLNPTETTTYVFAGTGGCLAAPVCLATFTVNVFIESTPLELVTASPSIITVGESTQLTASGGIDGSSANIYWYLQPNGGGPSFASGPGPITVSPTETTTYYVRRRDNCLVTADASVTVTVEPPCVLPTYSSLSTENNPSCAGDPVLLNIIGGSLNSGETWALYTGSCGGTEVTTTTGTSFIIYPTETTTYYFAGTGGCVTDPICLPFTVTINTESTPLETVTASPSTITDGESTQLTASGGTDGTSASIEWYTEPNGGGTNFASGSGPHTVSPTETTTYYSRREDACGATADASVTVIVEEICNIEIIPVRNPYCDDNDTPAIKKDDVYYIELEIGGSGLGTKGWIAKDDRGNVWIGDYHASFTFGPYEFKEEPVIIAFSDKEDRYCKAIWQVDPPIERCSNLCDIQVSVKSVICDPSGTPYDSSDDQFLAVVQVFSSNTYSNWVADDPLATSGKFGKPVLLGPFPISKGNQIVTFKDRWDETCSTSVQLIPPNDCSDQCLIDAVVNEVICDDSGNDDPADDTYSVNITVLGKQHTGNCWNLKEYGYIKASGVYNEPVVLGPYLVKDGIKKMTFRDCTDDACTVSITVDPAVICDGEMAANQENKENEDIDFDGIPDALDNCPYIPNSGQLDSDSNGIGDHCEVPVSRLGIVETGEIRSISGQSDIFTFPNPFREQIKFRFSLSKTEDIKIEIFDVQGQRIWHYQESQLNAGMHELIWLGQSEHAKEMPAGIYMVRLQTGSNVKMTEVVLLR